MGRKKKVETPEKLVTRAELIALRGLTEDYIKRDLGHLMHDLGYRTKKYKVAEVDAHIAQTKTTKKTG